MFYALDYLFLPENTHQLKLVDITWMWNIHCDISTLPSIISHINTSPSMYSVQVSITCVLNLLRSVPTLTSHVEKRQAVAREKHAATRYEHIEANIQISYGTSSYLGELQPNQRPTNVRRRLTRMHMVMRKGTRHAHGSYCLAYYFMSTFRIVTMHVHERALTAGQPCCPVRKEQVYSEGNENSCNHHCVVYSIN